MDDGDLGFRLHHLRGRLGLFSGGPLTGPPHDHRTVPYGDWRQAADQFIDEELVPAIAEKLPKVERGEIWHQHAHNSIALLAVLVSSQFDEALRALQGDKPMSEQARAVLLEADFIMGNFCGGEDAPDWPTVKEITSPRDLGHDWRVFLSIDVETKISNLLPQIEAILRRRQDEHFACSMAEIINDGGRPLQEAELYDLLTGHPGGVARKLDHYFTCLRAYDHRQRHPEGTLEEIGRQSWWPTHTGEQKQKVDQYIKKAETLINQVLAGGAIWRI